jgi:hypothetical protein
MAILNLLAEKVVKVRRIPELLIAEMLQGKPVYYQGYKQVLSRKLKPDDIMGVSDVQGFFTNLIKDFLTPLLKKDYKVIAGELGIHLKQNDNLSVDIAIIPREMYQPSRFRGKYINYPPSVVVEIDINIDPTASFGNSDEYVNIKTQTLLDFGVEQVVWVFTKSRKIMVATQIGPWLTMNWVDKISVLGYSFSIEQLIEEDGFDPSTLFINQ